MIWSIILCIFCISIGIRTFNGVTESYKLRPRESPAPEQAGVVTGTAILCILIFAINKKKSRNNSNLIGLSHHTMAITPAAGLLIMMFRSKMKRS